MPYLKAQHLTAQLRKFNEKSEKTNRKLIYFGGKIRFQSETDLENYIETNFNEIFPDFVLLKRQHSIKMQRCDLFGCAKSNKQPVIIELKNEEDRYIVSQLIRYRKAILTDKPFADEIDYSLPVKLVAIAPSFHEDNYTDKEASKFENDLCFWAFRVENQNNSGKFKLCDNTYDIPYPIFGLPDVPASSDVAGNILPAFTLNFVGKLPTEYINDFIYLRSLFMSQPKIKEMVSPSYSKILYGTGQGENHKKLAEITNTNKSVCLFLWLPTHVKTNIKIPVARFGFILAKDNSPLSKTSIIEWIVCTKDNIELKNKPSTNIGLSSNRHGMVKWSQPNLYIAQATFGSSNTFWLIMYLLKGITPPIDDATSQWWESYKIENHNGLGWYIDLAIKTWNYRFKKP
ncbi:MAG: hypothetical protein KME08_05735 [Aphanothece sp. CMT-3BRIN-NPC111]|jgi:hypothetical protein|nr:hypothetical protein [Aphanothece sp. CMT-3BRIN-NPC111]